MMSTDPEPAEPETDDQGVPVVGWRVIAADGTVLSEGAGVLLSAEGNLADNQTGAQPDDESTEG